MIIADEGCCEVVPSHSPGRSETGEGSEEMVFVSASGDAGCTDKVWRESGDAFAVEVVQVDLVFDLCTVSLTRTALRLSCACTHIAFVHNSKLVTSNSDDVFQMGVLVFHNDIFPHTFGFRHRDIHTDKLELRCVGISEEVEDSVVIGDAKQKISDRVI